MSVRLARNRRSPSPERAFILAGIRIRYVWRRGRGRRDVRGQSVKGQSLGAASARKGVDRAAQTKFRSRVLAGLEDRWPLSSRRDRMRRWRNYWDAFPTTAAISTLRLELDRLGLTVKKPYTPTNSGDLMSRPPAAGGPRRRRPTILHALDRHPRQKVTRHRRS
jgi:hypothetical protein